jgi:DNA-binding MarR family transcriptional regulator
LTQDEMATWRTLDRLLSELPHALERQLDRDADLSLIEYYVLAGLSDQPEHTIRISRLAELTFCELSRMSHLVRRLERRGLVSRRTDPVDRRSTLATLTTAGLEHLQSAAPAHVATVRRFIFDPLSRPEQHALREAAEKIVSRLGSSD